MEQRKIRICVRNTSGFVNWPIPLIYYRPMINIIAKSITLVPAYFCSNESFSDAVFRSAGNKIWPPKSLFAWRASYHFKAKKCKKFTLAKRRAFFILSKIFPAENKHIFTVFLSNFLADYFLYGIIFLWKYTYKAKKYFVKYWTKICFRVIRFFIDISWQSLITLVV